MTNPTPHGQVPEELPGDKLREIARSARTSASDSASPEEYVLAGWRAAQAAALTQPAVLTSAVESNTAGALPAHHTDNAPLGYTIHEKSAWSVGYEEGYRASHGQAPAHVLHLVQDAFAEVAMAYPKAFALHKVGLADTAVRKALAAYTPQAADSVQEDAARLDFIERHPEMSLRHRKGRWAFLGFTNYEYEMLPSLRAAIDAAMTDAARKQGASHDNS